MTKEKVRKVSSDAGGVYSKVLDLQGSQLQGHGFWSYTNLLQGYKNLLQGVRDLTRMGSPFQGSWATNLSGTKLSISHL